MKPLDRKAELVRRGVRMSAIGAQLGVTRNHVSLVVAGKRRSPTVEAAVAEALGMSVKKVFPPAESAAHVVAA